MSYLDAREWIELADKIGELRRINGARWEEEIGQITELAQHREDGPTVLFDEIPGFPKGFRVLVNSLGSLKRTALTLGIPPREKPLDLIRAWREYSKTVSPLPPKVVTDGPILENVKKGKEINMLTFPTPKWHEHDGGRYIGTGSIDITQDPDDHALMQRSLRLLMEEVAPRVHDLE